MESIKLEGTFRSADNGAYIYLQKDDGEPGVICLNQLLKDILAQDSRVVISIDVGVMTRDGMIKFIKTHPNVKISHELFANDEYIYSKEDGNVYDENGYLFEDWYSPFSHDGIRFRSGKLDMRWETGWKLFNELQSSPNA